MKKLLSLLLALALFVSVLPAIAEPAPADTDEAVGLPAVGDVVEGFEVKEIRPSIRRQARSSSISPMRIPTAPSS